MTSPAEYILVYSAGLVFFTFAVSGAAKLRGTDQTLTAMTALGVPRVLRREWIARLLPIWELLLAAALLLATGPLRSLAGLLAAGTLGCFTVLLAVALRSDDDVDCACFGTLAASNRVTGWSVARNLVLIAAAMAVTVLGFASEGVIMLLVEAPAPMWLGVCLAWAVTLVIVLSLMLRSERREAILAPGPGATGSRANQNQESPAADRVVPPLSEESLAAGLDPARPGEPSMGDPIPDVELVTDRGLAQPLRELGYGRPVLLVFLSAECSSCLPVADAVPRWRSELSPMEVRVATSSTPEAIGQAAPEILPYTRYGARAARHEFALQRSPAAVALGGQQHPIVASPIAYGLNEIEGLVRSLADRLWCGL